MKVQRRRTEITFNKFSLGADRLKETQNFNNTNTLALKLALRFPTERKLTNAYQHEVHNAFRNVTKRLRNTGYMSSLLGSLQCLDDTVSRRNVWGSVVSSGPSCALFSLTAFPWCGRWYRCPQLHGLELGVPRYNTRDRRPLPVCSVT